MSWAIVTFDSGLPKGIGALAGRGEAAQEDFPGSPTPTSSPTIYSGRIWR